MLNNLKKMRDTVSEKTKLLIYLAAAVIIFLTSCLLPLAFIKDSIIDPDFGTGERAAMFIKYMANDKSVKYKVINDPDKSEVKFCEKLFSELNGCCIIDSSVRKTLTEDSEYITLTDGENTMKLCRMWLQDKGDWNNWIDVYMDSETGFVYYLYVNSICVSNGGDYASAIDPELDAKNIAALIAKETGYEMKLLNWSGKPEDTATAYTSLNGDAVIWNINYSYYPSSTLDIKISVA